MTDTMYEDALPEGWRAAAVYGRPDDTPEQTGPPRPMPIKPNHKPRRKPRGRVIGKCLGCGRPDAPLLPPGYTLCRWCGWGRTS